MNEFHFAEMIQGAVSNGLTSFTIWLTIVSGYMYVANGAVMENAALGLTILMFFGLLASLYFMINIRREKL
ncbi:MAG: hypothetical protein V7459_03905 [Oceanicoccus sp.]